MIQYIQPCNGGGVAVALVHNVIALPHEAVYTELGFKEDDEMIVVTLSQPQRLFKPPRPDGAAGRRRRVANRVAK